MNDNNKTMDIQLNEHNKSEHAPSHTAEHLLNQTMVRMFGCERSRNAHIERKKSKISYQIPIKPTEEQVALIVQKMNELIRQHLPVYYDFYTQEELPEEISTERLPDNASETVRVVKIGDYDACLCAGNHVRNTSEIGEFLLLGTNWDEEKKNFRIRYKVKPRSE